MVSIIAEVGSVHDGSFGNARKLIALAAECGADAVKFQTHIAEAETLYNAPSPSYFSGEPRYEYFKRTSFSGEQWNILAADCAANGVTFLSSPFSLEAVELLEEVGVSAYKIPSGEVANIPLLEKVANTGKPVYLSSGMSSWSELDEAVDTLSRGGAITVLQCSSMYPCPHNRVGLNVIAEMKERWGLPVGFSDHTDGIAAGAAAVALGATVVEKHITFSKKMYGSDAATAMEPADFSYFTKTLKEVFQMCSSPVDKDDITAYIEMKRVFEKSIVAARNLAANSLITEADFAYKKPGDGIPAREWKSYVGRRVRRAIALDEQLRPSDFF